MLTSDEFEQACICQTLRRVARKVTLRYEQTVGSVGLKAGQFTILAALYRDDHVPLGMLAKALGMDRTTLTKDLRPLERKGLVRSVPDQRDGRIRGLVLTDKGRSLLAEALPLWKKAQAASYERLDGADWVEIRKTLDRLAA